MSECIRFPFRKLGIRGIQAKSGQGGLYMKKNKKTALMAAVLTGAAMLGGCDHGGDDVQIVYGPPVTEATTTAAEPIQTEYGAPVAEEVTTTATKPVTVPALYGPPPTESFTTDAIAEPETDNKDIEEETVPYSPDKDKIQLVYGPPESFGE